MSHIRCLMIGLRFDGVTRAVKRGC